MDIVYEHCRTRYIERIDHSDINAGTYLIVVSEGFKDASGKELVDETAPVDAFGHKRLAGAGVTVGVGDPAVGVSVGSLVEVGEGVGEAGDGVAVALASIDIRIGWVVTAWPASAEISMSPGSVSNKVTSATPASEAAVSEVTGRSFKLAVTTIGVSSGTGLPL